MCIKAIRLDKTDELHYKILSAMYGEEKKSVRVKFAELAKGLGVSEEVIRYNVKKLMKLGYIHMTDDGYEPTDKVVFLKTKNG